jgi:hypothetical protein
MLLPYHCRQHFSVLNQFTTAVRVAKQSGTGAPAPRSTDGHERGSGGSGPPQPPRPSTEQPSSPAARNSLASAASGGPHSPAALQRISTTGRGGRGQGPAPPAASSGLAGAPMDENERLLALQVRLICQVLQGAAASTVQLRTSDSNANVHLALMPLYLPGLPICLVDCVCGPLLCFCNRWPSRQRISPTCLALFPCTSAGWLR